MATLTPDFDSFARAYEAGQNQVVYARLAADLDTPVSLMLKLTGAAKDAFVLESVTGGEVRGRYSIIGMKPDVIWQCHGTGSRINRAARYDPDAFETQDGDPLSTLRALIAESKIALPEDLPQAAAGLFGYLGYDMIRLVEHLPNINPDPLGLPDAVMMRPSVVAVLDGVKGEVTVVSPAWVHDGLTARAAYAQAAERVMDAVRDLERALPQQAREIGDAAEIAPPPPRGRQVLVRARARRCARTGRAARRAPPPAAPPPPRAPRRPAPPRCGAPAGAPPAGPRA